MPIFVDNILAYNPENIFFKKNFKNWAILWIWLLSLNLET